jgi:hypothetical protein
MPEPIIERLSRFTPDGAALDRDALLFNAGRASVRSNRGWILTVAMLAACQLLTLTLLWPSSAPPAGRHEIDSPAPRYVEAHPSPPDAAELAAMNRRLLASKDGDLPPSASSVDLLPSDPPLNAFVSPTLNGLE